MKTLIIFFLFLPNLLLSQHYFQKITTDPVVTTSNYNNIPVWGDYDNDNDLDLVLSSLNDDCLTCPTSMLQFRNNGNGSFTRIMNSSITQQNILGSGLAWGDYDNDGRLDLFVCGTLNSRNKLFHNDGNGNFSLVTTGIVVNDDISTSQASAWTDYNKDGWLDLFVANRFRSNFLYKNNGNGTFTKVTAGAIVNDISSSRSCAWGDYDNDSWPDLFVANFDGLNDFLYHNNGDGTFTRILNGPVVNDGLWGSACDWADYDNNGFLDLFVTNSGGEHNRLYSNQGNGNFTLNTSTLSQSMNGFGFTWGDYNNDGTTDIFIANRNNINTLYRNNGGAHFTLVQNEIVGHEGIFSAAGSFADYNNDGKLDLLVTNRFGHQFNHLYKNVGHTGNFITIKLKGCINHFGIGARIRVRTGHENQIKEITSGHGWGSGNSLSAHFGVGNAHDIDSIIVNWSPNSVTRVSSVNVNQFITLYECRETGIGEENLLLNYHLFQNYPNPFNPTTTISYEIEKSSLVNLTVYDLNGKIVATLVNENQNAGTFTVDFNGKDLASGIYFYKIKAGDFISIQKMTLVK